MTLAEQTRWWSVGLLILIAILYLFSGVLLPFVLGAAIAYFTDPLADRLEAKGLSRTLATVVITAAAMLVFCLALIILMPLLIDQIRLAVDAAPEFVGGAKSLIEDRLLPLMMPDAAAHENVLTEALGRFQDQVRDVSLKVFESALTISLAGIEFISLAVITPVVAFYLLLDWDHMIARIDELLPRDHADTIRELSTRIDRVLAGFVRGQLTVCLVLGAFYAVSLMLVGLPFGLIVGLFAGLISFIPFIGSILGGLLSLGIALFHFWDAPVWIAAVAAIFVIGQVVEGNYLTPKLVGGSVGLHPVWLMFALSAFGALFGFTGLLIAVPVAAVIGVFLRFSIEHYKEGRLYRGVSGAHAPKEDP